MDMYFFGRLTHSNDIEFQSIKLPIFAFQFCCNSVHLFERNSFVGNPLIKKDNGVFTDIDPHYFLGIWF